MIFAGMSFRGGHSGQRSSSNRGRGRSNILIQHGKQKLIATDLSHGKEYQEYLEYKKILESNSDLSQAKEYQEFLESRKKKGIEIVSSSDSQEVSKENNPLSKLYSKAIEEDDIFTYTKLDYSEVIILLEKKDCKWQDEPWNLMSRYLDNSYFKTKTYKGRIVYEEMLIASGTCEFNHFSSGEVYNFSKMTIKKIFTIEDWGISPQREKEFLFRNTKVKYNYWDYIDAFNTVLLYENDKHRHTWWIKICGSIFNKDIPSWFFIWWQSYGTNVKILPEVLKEHFKKWVNISPKIIERNINDVYVEGIASLYFFTQFSIPYIWKWAPEFCQSPGFPNSSSDIPCLKRNFYTKFWDKMIKVDPTTEKIFGFDTVELIKGIIRSYENLGKENSKKEISPFECIQKKIRMKSDILSKDEMIELYLNEMKKDLHLNFSGGSKSQKSDTSMADYTQDAQDPNDDHPEIEDIFEVLKETVKARLAKQGESSRAASEDSMPNSEK